MTDDLLIALKQYREICRQLQPQIADAGLADDLARAEAAYLRSIETDERFITANERLELTQDHGF